MKKIFLVLIIFIVFGQSTQTVNCNLSTIKQALAPRIFAEQTIDGRQQQPLITRFLHNKAGIIGQETGKCYSSYIDPNFLIKNINIFGFLSLLYFIYYFIYHNLKIVILFALLPLFAIYNLPIIVIVNIYKLFAIIGLTLFSFKK